MLSGDPDDDPFAALEALEEAVAASPRQGAGAAPGGGAEAASPRDHDAPAAPRLPPAAVGQAAAAAAPAAGGDEWAGERRHAQDARRPLDGSPYDQASPSGWDTDDDVGSSALGRGGAAPPPGPLPTAVAAPPPGDDGLGGSILASPSTAPAASAPFGDDDLDDLVGELLGDEARAPQHSMVPGFHCTGCDFQVMRAHGFAWADGVEYLFLRNNYPEFPKLRAMLKQQGGAYAYCCQCSWKSAHMSAELADVADGLRWRVVAH